MVFLIHPHKKCLVLVVINASAFRPVSAGIGRLQVSIAFFEQEMITDQLLLDRLCHPIQWVISALKNLTAHSLYGHRHLSETLSIIANLKLSICHRRKCVLDLLLHHQIIVLVKHWIEWIALCRKNYSNHYRRLKCDFDLLQIKYRKPSTNVHNES